MIFADIPIFGAQEVITPRSPSAADIPAGMGEVGIVGKVMMILECTCCTATIATCQECTQDLARLQLFGHSMSEAAIC